MDGVKTGKDQNAPGTGAHAEGWGTHDPATLYPADCHFRVIVAGDFAAEAELRQALAASEVITPLAHARHSAGGKFRSLEVSVRVKDRAELVRLDRDLRAVAGVRMVL